MAHGTVQVQWHLTFVQYSTESNHHDMNILVVKGTAHTKLKEIRAKAMVIALASFDIGCLKKSL